MKQENDTILMVASGMKSKKFQKCWGNIAGY